MNVAYKSFDIDLPQDRDNLVNKLTQENVVNLVIFNRDNDWLLNDKNISSFEDLKVELTKLRDSNLKKVNIVSDKSVKVDRLVKLLIFMKSEGIESSNIVVE